MAERFEVYPSGTQYRWRLVDGNNKTIASGEAYTTKDGAKRGAQNIKDTAPTAPIVETDD